MATVLVVDDEPDLRFLVRKLLEKNGHAVLEAGNGQRALEVLDEQAIDLLIVDPAMPVMDGRTLVREVREHGREALPIVLWSENVDHDLPVQAVFVKPYGGPDLARAVDRLTQRT